jgi:hypothetical protein
MSGTCCRFDLEPPPPPVCDGVMGRARDLKIRRRTPIILVSLFLPFVSPHPPLVLCRTLARGGREEGERGGKDGIDGLVSAVDGLQERGLQATLYAADDRLFYVCRRSRTGRRAGLVCGTMTLRLLHWFVRATPV